MVRNDFWRSHKEGPSNYFHEQIPMCLHKSSLESLEFQPKEQRIYKSQVQMTLISRVLLGGKSIHFTSKPNQQRKRKKTYHLRLFFPKKFPLFLLSQPWHHHNIHQHIPLPHRTPRFARNLPTSVFWGGTEGNQGIGGKVPLKKGTIGIFLGMF